MCFVNLSGKDITGIQVSGTSGFENATHDLAFLTGELDSYRSLCGYVELDSLTPTYTIKLTFPGGNLSFTDNQGHSWDTKFAGPIPHTGSPDFEVWQTLGGNVTNSAGTNAIYIRPAARPDNSSWMGDLLNLKPEIRLNELTMPGSHDAGMWTGCPDNAKTQSLSILDQLKAGSRYFDLRTCLSANGDVWTYHGPSWGDKLSNILSDVDTFLTGAGSKEVVILKFSHAYANSRQGTVNLVKKFNANRLYTGGTINLGIRPLSEVKGKLVAVFGSDDDSFENYWSRTAGIFPYHDVDSAAPIPVQVVADGLTVFDNYAHDGYYESMAANQGTKLANYGGLGKEYLFLLSWTLTGGGWVYDIEVLANMANPWLPRHLGEMTSTASIRPNIVYLDFIDPYISRAITDLNRHPAWRGMVSGSLTWISVGNDGAVWGVYNGNIWRREESTWKPIAGTLTQISVGSKTEVWGVNAGAIFKWDQNRWAPVAGPALSQISAAGDGTVWGVTGAGAIYRLDGDQWTPIGGALTRISVGSKTEVWGVNTASGNIFRWNTDPGSSPGWTQIGGPKLSDISVAADGAVWGVGADKKAYYRIAGNFYPASYNSGGTPGGPDLTQISVGSSAQIWAVNNANGQICLWS